MADPKELSDVTRLEHKTASTYQPPAFTDEQRLDKIRNILPTLQSLFEKEFETQHYPGLIYGLVVDGDLIHTHSFGHIDLERTIPTSSQSLFRIASMTKSVTAMAIVKLRDDGQLRLDDPVAHYIPQLNVVDPLTRDAPIMTIRHLLMQDAGMPEDDPWADRQLAIDDRTFLAMLSQGISISNPPGTLWEYSNLAYALLGRIITLVAQVSYQEYIQREILDPLGMTNTFWEFAQAPSELLARGYRWECERYVEEALLHDGVYGAMGGLISSMEDFSKYVSCHMQAWPARDEPDSGPVRRSSLREMHRPWNFIELDTYKHRACLRSHSYCYGLHWSKNQDGVVSVNHSGGLPGFGSNWTMLPEHGIGLISFANRTYADLGNTNAVMMDNLVTLANVKPRQLPIPKALADCQEKIVKLLLYADWNVAEAGMSELLAENFFMDQSLELRRAAADGLLTSIGKIQRIGEFLPKNQLRGRFNIEGEHGTVHVSFSLSPECPPLIQELQLEAQK